MRVRFGCVLFTLALVGCATPVKQSTAPTVVDSVSTQKVAENTVVDAPANSGAASTATAQSDDDDDRVICKREAALGTRLGKKVCRTKRQIDQDRELGQKQLDEYQRAGPLSQ